VGGTPAKVCSRHGNEAKSKLQEKVMKTKPTRRYGSVHFGVVVVELIVSGEE